MTQTTRIPFCNVAALGASLTVSLVLAAVAFPQNPPAQGSGGDEESRLPGTWRGDSLSVEKGTSCHDEIAVYRIASIPGKRGYLMASQIMDLENLLGQIEQSARASGRGDQGWL